MEFSKESFLRFKQQLEERFGFSDVTIDEIIYRNLSRAEFLSATLPRDKAKIYKRMDFEQQIF